MKSILFSIVIVSSVILFSCNKEENNDGLAEQTPEALAKENDLKEVVYSRGYSIDIIDKLYAEALSKDQKLAGLNKALTLLEEIKSDSLEAYNRYAQNNDDYWASVSSHIHQISDSVLKHEIGVLFGNLQIKNKERMAQLNEKGLIILQRTNTLHDQHILMKLLVTQPMMSNYQVNEFPNVKTLEDVIKQYDSVIKKTKDYTVIKKS